MFESCMPYLFSDVKLETVFGVYLLSGYNEYEVMGLWTIVFVTFLEIIMSQRLLSH